MKGNGWDLTSKHSLEGAAAWIRKRSDAVLVLIVRREDVVFDVALDVRPKDALAMVEEVMPDAMRRVNEMRLEARAKAEKRGK